MVRLKMLLGDFDSANPILNQNFRIKEHQAPNCAPLPTSTPHYSKWRPNRRFFKLTASHGFSVDDTISINKCTIFPSSITA